MFIQSGHSVLAYNASSKVTLQQQGGAIAKSSPASLAQTTDQVTLSAAGKALAASEQAITQPRTPGQENLLSAASSDRASAEKIAYDMALTPSSIAWDIRGQAGVGDGTGEFVRKLATTGQIVGDDYIDSFSREAKAIDMQRRTIYETEKAKGTDPLQILSMMIDFTNSQSKDYLEATGWINQANTSHG